MQQTDSIGAIGITDKYKSILEILDVASKKYCNKVALVCDQQELSYAELSQLSIQFAHYLKLKGLEKGDVIALVMPNVLAYPIALFAAYRLGLTVVNMNPMYTFSEIYKVVSDCEIKAVVVFAPMLENIAKLPSFNNFKSVVSVTPGPLRLDQVKQESSTLISFIDALNLGKTESERNGELEALVKTEDVAFLQYTGGTTGQPKAAMLTHSNIVSCINQFELMTPYIQPSTEVVLAPLPLYHIFGLVIGLLSSLSQGSTILLISDPRDLPKMANLFREWSITMMYGVNALYSGLYHAGNLSKKDFASLKLCGSGATALSKSTAQKWHELTGCSIIEGYGMTETSGLISFMSENTSTEFGTVGLTLPNCETTIRDEHENILLANVVGELCVTGPNIMSGYYNASDETDNIFCADGALKTGDLARIDEHGYIWLVDRVKDMINVSGFNVYPNEIEQVINLFDGVLESACVSAKNDKSGEIVKAYIVSENGEKIDTEALLEHCRERLAAYKIPKLVELIAALPKSPVGKILRKDLKE
ncbi:AMP-binding protein [Paraglaciecola arctica]|uniref:AMP-binding protein n=1 Tax=Paraglaciecola arctica TaxID=1128911 RepID=UPI001C077449|nr:AMP-binding protein [Paraglaciecola arctica]MBU3004239.1 AMP-binding protein [Paraglaciecola arctica]